MRVFHEVRSSNVERRKAASLVGEGICHSCEDTLDPMDSIFFTSGPSKTWCRACKEEIEKGEVVHCEACGMELVVGMAHFIGGENAQVVLCTHCRNGD